MKVLSTLKTGPHLQLQPKPKKANPAIMLGALDQLKYTMHNLHADMTLTYVHLPQVGFSPLHPPSSHVLVGMPISTNPVLHVNVATEPTVVVVLKEVLPLSIIAPEDPQTNTRKNMKL